MSTNTINNEPEEIEGLGKDEDSSFGDYPIDTLLIRNESRTVHDVLPENREGIFYYGPGFGVSLYLA